MKTLPARLRTGGFILGLCLLFGLQIPAFSFDGPFELAAGSQQTPDSKEHRITQPASCADKGKEPVESAPAPKPVSNFSLGYHYGSGTCLVMPGGCGTENKGADLEDSGAVSSTCLPSLKTQIADIVTALL